MLLVVVQLAQPLLVHDAYHLPRKIVHRLVDVVVLEFPGMESRRSPDMLPTISRTGKDGFPLVRESVGLAVDKYPLFR